MVGETLHESEDHEKVIAQLRRENLTLRAQLTVTLTIVKDSVRDRNYWRELFVEMSKNERFNDE